MQPIFFPHTFISDDTLRTLTACFDKITVYQPTLHLIPKSMSSSRDSGQLEIRCPTQAFETEIVSSLRRFEHLGTFHRGRSGEIKQFLPSGIPFFDDSSPQKIRNDILSGIQIDTPPTTSSTPDTAKLIHAALFLQMAQDLDLRQDEVRQSLATCTGMEKKLFKELKEDEDLLFQELNWTPLPSVIPSGEHRLEERLSTWTRLFFYDLSCRNENTFPGKPIFFLTVNPSLFDEILLTDGVENVLFSSMAPHQIRTPAANATLNEIAETATPHFLSEKVHSLASPTENDSLDIIRIAVIPNCPPFELLSRRTGVSLPDMTGLSNITIQPNTIIGLLSTIGKDA